VNQVGAGQERGAVESATQVVDHDIHGLVGIRLIDPSAPDVEAVSDQVGSPGTLYREPDISIRFVREVGSRRPLKWIEPGVLGFADEGLFVFTADSAGEPASCVNVDASSRRWQVQCRSGLGAVPLLLPLVDLIMSRRGLHALHASAFTYNETGVLVAGWARSGKTTSLLAFMARGAAYIGDDRVYLQTEDNRLYGLPSPVALRAPHLDELPRYGESAGWRARSRLRAFAVVERAASAAAAIDGLASTHVARRIAGLASDASISISPHALFGGGSFEGRLEKAFLAIAHDSPDVRVEAIEPRDLAQRLLFSLRAERLRISELDFAFHFAFPDRPWEFGEEEENTELDALARALERGETYVVYHPHPAPADALQRAMAPLIG
jgi:hypothetical protein